MRDLSREQEERVLGGSTRRRPGSGNQWHGKGDASSTDFLVECKRTDKQSITIKNADLVKITDEAVVEGRLPVMAIEIGGRDYVLLAEDDFMEVTAHLWDGDEQ